METRAIVSPEELRRIQGDVRIVDARAGDGAAEAYRASHLAGALRADPETDLATPSDPAHGGRHPLPALDVFRHTLGRWGITPELDVVVYDDKQGANAAARLWWMLRAVGHARVAVLDGGWQAALEAGLPTDAEVPSIAPVAPYPASRWVLPISTIDDVDGLRLDPSWRVLDVRAAYRYRGESDPFDPVAGHIPGAINVPYSDNLDATGRFKSPSELRAAYEPLLAEGGASRLVVHCGSGVTACHTLVALELAGLAGASLYVGSWSEWCRRDRPLGRSRTPS